MASHGEGTTWLIINGKSAQQPDIRSAVTHLRERGHDLAVRVTWEGGDGTRLVDEAVAAGAARVIAGGGDGSINETVAGLMRHPVEQRPALGILPLGSANDFAHGLELPMTPAAALELALTGDTRRVDVGMLDDEAFINVASGGFGAEITTSTPVGLKRLLGGGAYSLMGMLKAWNYQPFEGHLRWPEGEARVPLFMLAIGNGAQAGGGQRLAPSARIDDGLLELLFVRHFNSLGELKRIIDELENLPNDGQFVRYLRVPWVEFDSDGAFPLNLDGEPRRYRRFRASLESEALPLVVPSRCPLLSDTR
ncbi:lipid kinase YegS [Salinicola endophyticus]|uniref:Probable lipid kinase YegS-like n=1 Tax=Salinicola endophyticus TaxID=1949083 RepID=A0ABY8FRM8_9GAMM|nr:lipid kinase YegS [Salinicola endophyticus]WFF42534.1 lipid kinase YegS [Salinicola endophyticus]